MTPPPSAPFQIVFRPSFRSPEMAKMFMDAGAVGVVCAKVSQAEQLVHGGVSDILLGNEVVGLPFRGFTINVRAKKVA